MNSLHRRFTPLLVRAASFVGGVAIIYHEVVVSESSEPLLVFVGLWLAGAPIADALDKLRRLASLTGELTEPPPPLEPPTPAPESEQ